MVRAFYKECFQGIVQAMFSDQCSAISGGYALRFWGNSSLNSMDIRRSISEIVKARPKIITRSYREHATVTTQLYVAI